MFLLIINSFAKILTFYRFFYHSNANISKFIADISKKLHLFHQFSLSLQSR